MPAPRIGEAYAEASRKGLAKVGLAEADVLAGISDHEGSVRKGLRASLSGMRLGEALEAPARAPHRFGKVRWAAAQIRQSDEPQ